MHFLCISLVQKRTVRINYIDQQCERNPGSSA